MLGPVRVGPEHERDAELVRLGEERRSRERLADRLAQAPGVDLDAHAGRRHGAQRRTRGGRHSRAVTRRPELLGVVQVADHVEQPRLGRLPRQLQALEVDAVDAVGLQPSRHLGVIEAEAVADDVHRADDVLERVLPQRGRRLLQRVGDEVGLDAEHDAHVALVLAREAEDGRAVVVQFVRAHGPVVGEVVQGLPAAEERQVVGEAHLVHAQHEGALDVLPRLALGVPAHDACGCGSRRS